MAQALVTTQWVADNRDSVRLIEVDVDTTQYEQGHIPGAVASTGRRSCKTRQPVTLPRRKNSPGC